MISRKIHLLISIMIGVTIIASSNKMDREKTIYAVQNSEIQIFLPLISHFISEDDVILEMENQKEFYQIAILDLEQAIEVAPDGSLSFAYISPAPGIPQAVYDDLITSLGETNAQLEDGELDLIDISLDSAELFQEIEPTGSILNADISQNCGGRTSLKYYWWGAVLFLNSCDTEYFLGALSIGGATLCTGLGLATGGIPGALCGAAVGAYEFYLLTLNHIWGRGVYMASTWRGYQWAWHQ